MLEDFLASDEVERAERTAGTALFLSSTPGVVPRSLLHNFRHNHVLHRETYLLRIRIDDIPRVPLTDKLAVESLGGGVFTALLRLGYMERASYTNILSLLGQSAYPPTCEQPSLFLSRARIDVGSVPRAARWRARLYGFMQRNAPSPALLLDAPPEQVIEIGVQHQL